MKRIVCVFIACLLLTAAGTSALAQSEPDTQNAAPIVLLGEEYNLFYSVLFPDSYTLTYVKCNMTADYGLYKMGFTTPDSADAVVTFAANLAGIVSANDIENLTNQLSAQGMLELNGAYKNSPLLIEIQSAQSGGDATSDGYMVKFQAWLWPIPPYTTLFERNLEHPVFQAISEYIPLFPLANASITITTNPYRAEMFSSYSVSNAQEILDALLAAYPDQLYAENNWLLWRIGEMQLVVPLENAAEGELSILANFASPEISLVDYAAQEESGQAEPVNEEPTVKPSTDEETMGHSTAATLQSLGFDDYRNNSAKCVNQNTSTGAWISVSKDIWGEVGSEGERNAVTMMTKEHDAFVMVFYYPQAQSYSIKVDYNGESADYWWLANEDRYTDAYGNDDLADATRITTAAFLAPGEDFDGDVLKLAIMQMIGIIQDNFDCTPDELFAMNYE